MSKKNNKTKKKKYVEMTKQLQRDNDEEAKRKKALKLARISANKLMEEIDDIGLEEEKPEKMDVEKKESKHHKKKGFRMKHGRYS